MKTLVEQSIDACDNCGRPMPFTGAQLCVSCEEYERRREHCIVCGARKVFIDDTTCSDACDTELEGWPEP